MKILIGTNIFGNNPRQDIARESWMHLQKSNIDTIRLLAVQYYKEYHDTRKAFLSDEPIEYQDFKIPVTFKLEKSSRYLTGESEKDVPSIKEILDTLYKEIANDKNVTHFAYINSDCILTKNFVEYIQQNEVNAFAASRLDVEPFKHFKDIKDKGINVIRSEPAGFDFFCFSKQWWKEYRHLFPDMLIGQPLFDVLYAGIIMLYGGKILNDPQKPIICHIHHENVSHRDSPEKRYNEKKIKDSPFNQLVVNMMYFHLQYNLCNRREWGRFLTIQPGETQFTENFFNAMRLDTEKVIKKPY